MPAPGSSWSRSEWLRRLGFKTGQEPPLVTTIQPTLGSGDASELLPPLLAPQGWARADVAAGGVGVWGALEIVGAIGGSFIRPDMAANYQVGIFDARPGTFTPGASADVVVEVAGMTSVLTGGTYSAVPTPTAPFGNFASATLNEFMAPEIYIGPGRRGYVIHQTANSQLFGSVHVRDVPVGIAPD